MGAEQITVQSLRIMRVEPEAHLLAVKGAVPGHRGGLVLVRKALKRPEKWKLPAPQQVTKDKAKAVKKEAAGKKTAAKK